MPKETINPRHHGSSDNPASVAQVGWSAGLDVQVGVVAGGDYNERAVERPQMWTDLDRDGINKLIRLLRKARDAAYGADA